MIKNKQKLSIITVNYNDKVGLEKTIKSVIKQSFTDYEFIVIDGGSNDGSKELIESYKDKVTYWVSEKDEGIYNAMNKGIKVAQGEYCLFLNGGDSLYSDTTLEAFLDNDFNQDLIYGNLVLENEMESGNVLIQKDVLNLEHLYFAAICHQSVFIKLDMLIQCGLFDEKYTIVADYFFLLYAIIIKKASYLHINEIVCIYNNEGCSSIESAQKFIDSQKKDARLEIAPERFWDFVIEKINLQKKYKGLMSSNSVRISLRLSSFLRKINCNN